MAATDKNIVLYNSTATSTGNGSELNLPEPFTSCILILDVSAASGTSPTLNVRLQEVLTKPASGDAVLGCPSGTKIYDDFVAFAQATGTGTQVLRLVGGGNTVNSLSAGALAASTMRNGPIGSIWRVQFTIAGTSPSFSFSVTARLIP